MATSAQVVPVASVYQSLLAGDIGRPYYTARTSLNTLALLDPLTTDEVREDGSNSLRWWRRRESNPRPEAARARHLRAYPAVWVRETGLPQAGFRSR